MTTNTENLEALTNAELVGIYNGLCPEAPLKAWKGKKSVLIERIVKLRDAELSNDTTASAPIAEEPVAEAPVEAEEPEAPQEDETGEAPAPTRTVRAAALELLCHVAYYEDRNEKPGDDNRVEEGTQNARSVGIPYDEIIRRIHVEFPDCQTSVACLRWYAVKVRAEEFGYENLRLPQRRPRVKPTKKG